MPVTDNLDYQTIFQILVAFEGFSVWKGTTFCNPKNDQNIGIDLYEKLQGGEFADRCEALKTSKEKLKDIFRLGIMVVWSGAKELWFRVKCVWIWRFLRWVYATVGLALRLTPFVTIPALAYAYIYQFRCDGLTFKNGIWVLYFILVKIVCYALCAGLSYLLAKHLEIKVPFKDNKQILNN